MFFTRVYDIASNEVFNFWADIYHDHKVGLYFDLSRMMTISAVIGTQFNDNWPPFDAIGYFLKYEGFVSSVVSEIFEMINMEEWWDKLFTNLS